MRRALILPVLVVLIIGLLSSLYIVDERQKALRLWFGEVTAVVEEPGLNFKIPLLHEIVFYDDRILPLDTQPLEVTPFLPLLRLPLLKQYWQRIYWKM